MFETSESIFFDPSGPFGLTADFFLNGITEIMGVIISILISIYFANVLDKRAESKRASRQRVLLAEEAYKAVQSIFFAMPERVVSDSKTEKTKLPKPEDYKRAAGLWINLIGSIDNEIENVDPLVTNVIGEYGIYADQNVRQNVQGFRRHLRSIKRVVSYESRYEGEFPVSENVDEAIEIQSKHMEFHFKECVKHVNVLRSAVGQPRISPDEWIPESLVLWEKALREIAVFVQRR